MFGFGYNGNRQLSSVLQNSKNRKNDIVITNPIEICPFLDSNASSSKAQNDECNHQSLKNPKINIAVKQIVISWDSILFICEDGSWNITGFRSKDGLHETVDMPFKSLTSGCLMWDSVVLVTEGICYGGTLRNMKELILDKSDPNLDSAASISFVTGGGNHCFSLTDSQRVVSVQKTTDSSCFILRPITLQLAIKELSCGKEHTLMLSRIGAVFSCGKGGQGQLGHGDIENYDQPVVIEALQCVTMTTIAAGGWHSVAISDIGDMYVWGWNERGQLGFPAKIIQMEKATEKNLEKAAVSSERDVELVNILELPAILDLESGSDINVSKVACGSRHTVALTEHGVVYVWGWNKYGQLGLGDRTSRDQPTCVEYFSQNNLCVTNVFAGYWNTVIATN